MGYVEHLLEKIDDKLDYILGEEEVSEEELREIDQLIEEVKKGKTIPAEKVLE